jgi:L-threonylcarbamoyladenylate synthase
MTEEALAALRAGQLVVLPTDTVYGLCADGYREEPYRRLCRVKGRPEGMPTALLAAGLDAILDAVPEARGRAAVAARALLPGPYTLVLPNPARRFRWLTGATPGKIGVRVPELPGEAHEVVERAGALAATSANLHGGPDPARAEEVPAAILEVVAAVIDTGPLAGTPSTVLDLTGPEPIVLREGAVGAAEALARARAALSGNPAG